MLPLEGITVLDFSQFLAGPSAALRMADMGATVIKIEKPGSGDLGRQLYISDCKLDSDSTLFHTINRNKQGFAADLKNARDLKSVRELIAKADVLIENFRPGVMDRIGLGYEAVARLNSRLVYGTVTGYGPIGPWRDKPGQDLLIQALSGLTWLSASRDSPPTPMGVAIVDMFAGAHLTQGILASLVRRMKTEQGGRVEVSLLESALDLQFEVFTTFLNDGGQLPDRGTINSAHAYLSAPYGIYQTADGYVALAMASIPELGVALEISGFEKYAERSAWFKHRDAIQAKLADRLRAKTTGEWLALLEPRGTWCADVLSWSRLVEHDGFRSVDMLQTVRTSSGTSLRTTRCPIRIDGAVLRSQRGAPQVGEHTAEIAGRYRLSALADKRVGIVGLGTMGAPMASQLLRAGLTVRVYNRSPHKMLELAAQGAVVATSAADAAASCDLVILMVPDDAAVAQAISGEMGIAGSGAKNLIVINSSTVSPETNVEAANTLAEHGIRMLDAPVLGSRPQAESKRLFFLVGGEKEVYDECIPLFETLGRGHLHVGPIGAGACAKLANNVMGLVNLAAFVEGMKFAEAYGIAPEVFMEVVGSGGARSAMSDAKGSKLLARNWHPDFALRLAAKDLALAKQLARKLHSSSPVLDVATSAYAQAASDFGSDDIAALYRWYSSLGST